jgi:hypothetical protein
MKQSLKKCMMGLLGGCIDPCDDCPNMLAVKFEKCEPDQRTLDYNKDRLSPESLEELREMLRTRPIEDTLCQLEQGCKKCYKTACPTCQSFIPRGTDEENRKFCEEYMSHFP